MLRTVKSWWIWAYRGGCGLMSWMFSNLTDGSRSTVLQPLGWLLCIVTTGLVSGIVAGSPWWATGVMLGLEGVVVVTYLAAFIYFAKTSPDDLRSEKFTITKMAMERGIQGDNTVGIIQPPTIEAGQTIPLIAPLEVRTERLNGN